jgi:hypothetical protein
MSSVRSGTTSDEEELEDSIAMIAVELTSFGEQCSYMVRIDLANIARQSEDCGTLDGRASS